MASAEGLKVSVGACLGGVCGTVALCFFWCGWWGERGEEDRVFRHVIALVESVLIMKGSYIQFTYI